MIFLYFFMTFYWDPPKDLFVIPYLNHPLTWYGLFFACGFFIACFVIRHIFTFHLGSKERAAKMTDALLLFTIIGTLIGARLGHVFFYEWPYYSAHPFSILKIWEGGLASHGSAVGVLCALVLFAKRKKISFLAALEASCIAAALIGGFIRIGNFFNQEILGTATSLPWGVYFMHPVQVAPNDPLHPVQLYEALAYFAVFALLIFLWIKRGRKIGEGVIAGTFFLGVFSFRFLIEFIKLPQSTSDTSHLLNMGQILSLPFILVGMALLFFARKKSYAEKI